VNIIFIVRYPLRTQTAAEVYSFLSCSLVSSA
jgi:hypothetical protein